MRKKKPAPVPEPTLLEFINDNKYSDEKFTEESLYRFNSVDWAKLSAILLIRQDELQNEINDLESSKADKQYRSYP